MKYFTKEVRIALVAIVAIIVLYAGLQFLKGMSLFSSNEAYFVRFIDVSGLSASSPVYASGYRVGVVQRISYDYARPGNIIAAIDIDPKLQLHQGTHAEIVSDLLGNVKLELRFGPETTPLLSKGDTIDGAEQAGLMSKATDMLPQVQQLLPRLDSILASVQLLLANPALNGTLDNAEKLTASLTVTASQLQRLSAQLNRQLPQLMDKAGNTLDNTSQLTASLAALDLEATKQRVDRTLANVEQLTATLNSNKGTVGMLMNDPNLYQNITATMRDVDSLLIDFKLHPRRYINVSVFGKKAK